MERLDKQTNDNTKEIMELLNAGYKQSGMAPRVEEVDGSARD